MMPQPKRRIVKQALFRDLIARPMEGDRLPNGRPVTTVPDYGTWLARVAEVAPKLPAAPMIGDRDELAALAKNGAVQDFLLRYGLALAALAWYEAERLGRGVLVIHADRDGATIGYVPEYFLDEPDSPTAARAGDLRRWLDSPDPSNPNLVALVYGTPAALFLEPSPGHAAKLLEGAGIRRPA
jgi:hypothetical protein